LSLFVNHGLDVFSISSINLTALQLHSSGQDTIFRSPLIRVEADILDSLEGLLVVVLSSLGEGNESSIDELLVLENSRVGSFKFILLSELHGLSFVSERDGDDEGLVGVDDDADTVGEDEFILNVDGFKSFHGDVFTVSVLGEGLHTTDNLESAVLTDLTDVTGGEETVLEEGLLGLLGLLEVTLGDRGAADENLTTRIRLVSDLVGFGVAELHFDVGEETTGVLELVIPVVLDGASGTSFGEAVTLRNEAVTAEVNLHPFVSLGGEGSTTRDDPTAATTEDSAGVAEDLFVEEGGGFTAGDAGLAFDDGALVDGAGGGTDGRKAALDDLLEGIEDTGDTGEEDGFVLLEVTVGASGGVGEDTGVGVADGVTTVVHVVLSGEFKNVGERKVANVGGVLDTFSNVTEAGADSEDSGDDVTLGEHDTLGITSGTRGVHDDGEILRLEGALGHFLAETRVDDGRPGGAAFEDRVTLVVLFVGQFVSVDDSLEVDFVLEAEALELLHLLGVADDDLDFRFLEGVDEGVFAEVGVDSDGSSVGSPDTVGGANPFSAGVLVDGDLAAVFDAEGLETVGETNNLGPHFGVGLPGAVTEVVDFEFFAVGLLFLAGLFDLAVGVGGVLGVLFAGGLEEVDHRGDVLGVHVVDVVLGEVLRVGVAVDDVAVAIFDGDSLGTTFLDFLLEVVDTSLAVIAAGEAGSDTTTHIN